MEFKFTCQWFEVAFSGDPGFVEAQLEKYEPYVFKMLARIEQEGATAGGELPKQAPTGAHGEPALEARDQAPALSRHNKSLENSRPPSAQAKHNRSTNPHPGAFAAATSHAPVSQSMPSPEFPPRRRSPAIRAEDIQKVMEAKKPRTHHDRVMVFGYYMEHEGRGSDFTVSEIKKCYRAVSQEPGTNIDKVINHATRSGFIVRFDAGKTVRFKLSNKGRRYVEHGLRLA